MIIDQLLQFDPAGTAVTVTAASTNVLDMVNQRDMGQGDKKLDIVVYVQAAFTAAGAATLQVQLQASKDNAAWTTECETDAIPVANLTLGQQIALPLGVMQPQSAGIPRYYRLSYVVATGPFTAGTVEAMLVLDRQANNPPTYPSGFTVSN